MNVTISQGPLGSFGTFSLFKLLLLLMLLMPLTESEPCYFPLLLWLARGGGENLLRNL